LIWAVRDYPVGEDWSKVQDQLARHLTKTGDHQNTMMVSVGLPGGTERIYIELPNRFLLSMYPGFKEISEADLPERATLLVGAGAVFERRFKYLGRK
jgi:hypothetical protein